MNTHRRTLYGILVLLLGLLVVACGTPAEPDTPPDEEPPAEVSEDSEDMEEPTAEAEEMGQEPVTLTFVNWIGAEEATSDDLAAMLAAFEAEYDWITVESVALPFNETRDQVIVMSTGGDAPDVSMVHTAWVGPLVEGGFLRPVNDYLPNQDDYYPSLLNGKVFDGDQLLVAWAPSPIVMYYNIDLLNQAGYDAPPQTWDEMTQMATDIAALGDDIYGIGVGSFEVGPTGFYFLGVHMRNFGGELLDADGNVVVNSPENVAAFSWAQQLYSDGISPVGLEIRDFRAMFADGKLGFHFDGEFGVGILGGLNEELVLGENYGIQLIPGATAGEAGQTFFIEHMLAMYAGSEHPEEAALLIDFLTSPEGIEIYNANGGNKLPARESTAGIEFYSQPENAFMGTFIEALAVARPLPSERAAYSAALDEIIKAIQRVAIIGDDPAVVVEELDAEVREAYGQ